MRNTYNISLLRRRIQEALPRALSAVGESALEGFLALTGVSVWRPGRLGIRELSYVFDIGLPFALIGENPSAKPYTMLAADAVRDGRYPDAEGWRVVHAAALLSHCGAAVHFRTDRASPSPQLDVQLPGGATLDVEVRQPDMTPITDRATPRLLAIDVRGTGSRHEEISATFAADFARSEHVSGVLSFEPRFWTGIEQKEWIHLALRNPSAAVSAPAEILGKADTGRHALRLPLLIT